MQCLKLCPCEITLQLSLLPISPSSSRPIKSGLSTHFFASSFLPPGIIFDNRGSIKKAEIKHAARGRRPDPGSDTRQAHHYYLPYAPQDGPRRSQSSEVSSNTNMILRFRSQLLLVLSSLLGASVAQLCTNGAIDVDENPFGPGCGCDDQIWVGEGCNAGYWCFTAGDETGCYKVRQE